MTGDIDLPSSWARSARAILAHRLRKVLIMGATDRGKSTFCSYLAGTLRAQGASVAFVDADIGQKDVGPPATVALALVDGEGPLARARAAGLYFVGDVDPMGHFLPIIIGARRMVDMAQAEFVLIDTPGFVEGPGRALNAYQIDSLRPDAIIALQTGHELEPTLRAHRMSRILRVRPSAHAKPKPRSARRLAREEGFRTHFANGSDVALELPRVAVQRARVFVGAAFEHAPFAYAERTSEGVVAVGDATVCVEPGWRVLPPDFADNLLCGVLDASGECRGLALIRSIDFAHRRLHLLTPVLGGEIATVQLGDLYVGLDGRELGRKRPGLF